MYNFMTGLDDEQGMANTEPTLNSQGQNPGGIPGDANGNGIPDVMERTTTTVTKEKFAPRQAGGRPEPMQRVPGSDVRIMGDGPVAGTMPDGSRIIGAGGRIASFSAEEQQKAGQLAGGFGPYARRFMAEGAPMGRSFVQVQAPQNPQDVGQAEAFRLRGAGDSLMSDQHVADLRSDMGRIGSAQDRLAAAGRGSRAGVNRYNMMQDLTAQRAEEGRRLTEGLGSAERQKGIEAEGLARQADLGGRWKFRGEAATAAGNMGAAQVTAQQKAAEAEAQRKFEATRPVSLGGGAALKPDGTRSDAPNDAQTRRALVQKKIDDDLAEGARTNKPILTMKDEEGHIWSRKRGDFTETGAENWQPYRQPAGYDPFGPAAVAEQGAAPAAQPVKPVPKEGQTARAPGGKSAIFKGGKWHLTDANGTIINE